jgi:hypothetical protein
MMVRQKPRPRRPTYSDLVTVYFGQGSTGMAEIKIGQVSAVRVANEQLSLPLNMHAITHKECGNPKRIGFATQPFIAMPDWDLAQPSVADSPKLVVMQLRKLNISRYCPTTFDPGP